ncbi:hypothetical protein [Sphingomonas crocodyli]|uniref:Uncharacterized protein n=1 Tax=Sphingomonas crocodyli TaxID=1979270 RepID=A0A437LY20_9SPHN|nr:hypothetical protein [Sphingomonas crocodyli]RVT90223.1 hypothetical protein EOD43_18165 [Sphingomonas crocodyli]
MTKENLEELWVRSTTQCVHDPNLVNISLVVLLNGWDKNTREARARARATWTKVAERWDRELSKMSACDVEIEMLHITDGDQLRQMAQFGTRLFVAV